MPRFIPSSLVIAAALAFSSVASAATTTYLNEKFDDASRTDLNPTASAAWYAANSGSTYFTTGTPNGTLAVDNAGSRTVLAYFTAPGTSVTVGLGETLTLDMRFSVTTAPNATNNGVIIGLLQSVAYGAATSGTGFTAVGSPNTEARVSADFGSSNPTSNVFYNYSGYAAWTNLSGATNGITFRKRIGANAGLSNASAAWSTIGSAGGSGTGPVITTDCHAVLTLVRNSDNSMDLTYVLSQSGTTLTTHTVHEATASNTTFDTISLYMATGVFAPKTAADRIVLKQVDVTLTTAGGSAPPTIDTQPSNQTVTEGGAASFTVAATGATSYQWQKSTNGTNYSDIGGATSATYSIASAQVSDAASYKAIATNSGGSTPSNPATLTVNLVAPAITGQPSNQTVTEGGSATFTVVATGTNATYQWKKGGSDIGGATSASYTINNAQVSDAGSYTVVVTNSGGTVTSDPASLTVNVATPVITTQPADATVNVGDTASFTVAATGTSLSYQWSKGASAINGATSATLSLANVQVSDAGSYTVVVTNSGGNATSNAATLTVNTVVPSGPTITTAPANQTVTEGATATFTVVATGTGLSYQWQKGSSDISGAISATLNLSNVQVSDAGSYRVVVANAGGNATSTPATLTVNLAAPTITTQPANATVNVGDNASFTVVATGTNLSYQWSKGASAVGGATSATLSLTNMQAGDAGSYSVVVSNSGGNATSNTATLTVNAAGAPVITTQPVSQAVMAGANVTFNVVATGTGLSYQWKKAGVDISGATSATLALTNVQAGDAAVYTVAVTNSNGVATSNPATLGVLAQPTVVSLDDVFADGEHASMIVTPTSAYWAAIAGQTNGTFADGAVSAGQGSLIATSTSTATITVAGHFTPSGQPVNLAVGETLTMKLTLSFTGLASAPVQWRTGLFDSQGSRDTTNGDTGYGLWSYFGTGTTTSKAFNFFRRTTLTSTNLLSAGADFTAIGVAGGTFAPQTNATDYSLTYTVNRTGAATTVLTANITGGSVNYSATVTDASATPATTFDYYAFRMPGTAAATTVTVKELRVEWTTASTPAIATQPTFSPATIGLGGVAAASVAATGSNLKYQWLKDGVIIPEALGSSLTLVNATAADMGNYSVIVANQNGNVTSNVAPLTVTSLQAAPTIITQPANATIADGGNATFSVVAAGNSLTYQWQKGGVDILGATNPNLAFTAVSASDAGTYTVTVTNSAGSVTSNAVILTVNPPLPVINTQPVGITVIDGGTATFAVDAAGQGLSYQWRKGTTNITGATSSTLTLTNVLIADSGSTYSVVVSNASGSVTSSSATLTVTAGPPAITTQPVSQTITEGGSVTFSVVVTGTSPTFQWLKNGTNIAGAAASTLTLNNVLLADSGAIYSVLVTTGGGSVTSNNATLTVNMAAPSITTQPAIQNSVLGTSATFSVTAVGSSLSYQWSKGGTVITGATAASYTIPAVAFPDAGTYSVKVSNAAGTVTSTAAVLTVLDTYASYMAQYGLGTTGSGAVGADADNDGVSNLYEFALGGNPNSAGREILPTMFYTSSGSTTTLIYEFNRTKAAAANLTITVQYSSDLMNWTAAVNGVGGVVTTVTSVNSTTDHIVYEIPTTGSRLFVRLLVQ